MDFLEDVVMPILGLLTAAGVVIGGVWFLACIQFEAGEQSVSGVVYNTSNNNFLSGNTTFSIRASEDTYVSEENRSSYCIKKDSPYVELVNKASKDKTLKVIVTTEKYFVIAGAPWECNSKVKVELANG